MKIFEVNGGPSVLSNLKAVSKKVDEGVLYQKNGRYYFRLDKKYRTSEERVWLIGSIGIAEEDLVVGVCDENL
jgi:Mor family transcriptional regulator